MDQSHGDRGHHGGPDRKGGGGGPRPPQPGRRMPPPESTGAEANYLAKNKDARTPMVVQMTDGEEVRGIIEYYDRDMVKINRNDGPNVFIRKAHIRYMHKDESSGA